MGSHKNGIIQQMCVLCDKALRALLAQRAVNGGVAAGTVLLAMAHRALRPARTRFPACQQHPLFRDTPRSDERVCAPRSAVSSSTSADSASNSSRSAAGSGGSGGAASGPMRAAGACGQRACLPLHVARSERWRQRVKGVLWLSATQTRSHTPTAKLLRPSGGRITTHCSKAVLFGLQMAHAATQNISVGQ